MTLLQEEIAAFCSTSIRLKREEIWTDEKVYRPSVRREFSECPRLGFVGPAYQTNGCLLVGASGNSTEGQEPKAVSERYERQDMAHMILQENFKNSGSKAAWQALNAFEFWDASENWHVNWAIQGTLNKLDLKLEEIAFCNVIPFTSQEAPKRSCSAWRNGTRLFFEPLASLLSPKIVVWLGKAAFERSRAHLTKRLSEKEAVVNRSRSLNRERQFLDLDRLKEGLL